MVSAILVEQLVLKTSTRRTINYTC
jgi:hypothetical protein